MPKASKETASHVEDVGVMIGRYEELGGYTVGFETFREDADSAPLFVGLPDDRCQARTGATSRAAGSRSASATARRPTRRATPTTRRPGTRR